MFCLVLKSLALRQEDTRSQKSRQAAIGTETCGLYQGGGYRAAFFVGGVEAVAANALFVWSGGFTGGLQRVRLVGARRGAWRQVHEAGRRASIGVRERVST